MLTRLVVSVAISPPLPPLRPFFAPGVFLAAPTRPGAPPPVLRQGRLDRGAPPALRGRGGRGGEQPQLAVLARLLLLRGRAEEAGQHQAIVREGGVDVVGPAAQLLDGARGGEPGGGVPAPARRDQVEILQQVLVGEGRQHARLEASPGMCGCAFCCGCFGSWEFFSFGSNTAVVW